MDAGSRITKLLGLGAACLEARRAEDALAVAVPVVAEVAGASAAFVVHEDGTGADARVLPRSGAELDAAAVDHMWATAARELTTVGVPADWQGAGVVRAAVVRLRGEAGVLVLAWSGAEESDAGEQPGAALQLALATLDATLARIESEERLAEVSRRVASAQQLANMGDYEWHLETGVHTWSDELFRIYGHEPGAVVPSYETFLSLTHPEDRERISSARALARESGEPYQVIERIVRPDGAVRFLSSSGGVVAEDGRPVRMRGTSVDITERVLADRERERIALRFQSLVNAAPDAILVLAEDGRVLEANQRAHELLGGHVRGHQIHDILPGWPTTSGTADGTTDVPATGIDGRTLSLDVSTVMVRPVIGGGPDGDALIAVYLRDAETRLEREALAARLAEAQLRRRQALEINDSVVQGLVAAIYTLDLSDHERTSSFLDRTLTAARAMMDDLLEPLDGEGLQPGDLVRVSAAAIGPDAHTNLDAHRSTDQRRLHRVLVVDDAEDLRLLLRDRIELVPGLTVVGEAADGLAAVELAAELQPDLVMLDLAMPRMDGLEALPLIRAAVPGVRVIVLSGFNESTMAQKALEAGADHYVVKGGSMNRLLELVDELLAPAS